VSNTTFTSRLSTSRGWTLALGIGAAILAGILLVAYIVEYRSSVKDSAAPTSVLVAKRLIPKGTSGSIIAEQDLFQTTSLPRDDLKLGAISDPAYLAGRVTTVDIFPGQQLTTGELSAGTTSAIQTQIAGEQRAFALPSAGSRGLVGFLADGDRVDIYYGSGASGSTVLALLAANVLVLRAPSAEGSPVVLRGESSLQAQRLMLAADSGTLWYVLRPTTGAENPPRRAVSTQQLLSLITSQRRGG
jgi:Flp pilus assembly protein CpaB